MRPSPSAERSARFADCVFRRLPLLCLAVAAAVAAVVGPGWSERISPLPWIVSLAVCGLPHGAADFAVSRGHWRGWPLVTLWLAYAGSMIAVAACFAVAPAFALAAFGCLSVWHFGLAHADTGPPPPAGRVVAAVARGCPVLAAPLWLWPAATAGVAGDLVSLVVSAGPEFPPDRLRVMGASLGLAGLGGLIVEGLADRLVGGRAGLRNLLVEVGVITALGALTHPLFSVGLYFLVWHGWRQMGPLACDVTGVAPESPGALAAAVGRVHAAALPLLVPAWVAIGVAWWAWSRSHSPYDLAILSIGGYLVVTPAHELLGDLRTLRAGGRSDAVRGGDVGTGGVAAAWGLSRGRFWERM
jgi:Brp/Blh family beta-carotene 15,15'-monooxygenase